MLAVLCCISMLTVCVSLATLETTHSSYAGNDILDIRSET